MFSARVQAGTGTYITELVMEFYNISTHRSRLGWRSKYPMTPPGSPQTWTT